MKDIFNELSSYLSLAVQSRLKSDKKGAKQFEKFALELFPIAFPEGKVACNEHVEISFQEPIRLLCSVEENKLGNAKIKEYCWRLIHVVSCDNMLVLSEICKLSILIHCRSTLQYYTLLQICSCQIVIN